MHGSRCRIASVAVLAVLAAVSAGGARTAAGSTVTGTWRPLPAAQLGLVENPVSVWTGTRVLVFGRVTTTKENGEIVGRSYVAAAYDPVANTWRRLADRDSANAFYGYDAVWTGTEMLVWGQGTHAALDPETNRWRPLPAPPMDGAGVVVWTGREMIGWGGGCCGDAWSDGAAYNPETNRWRKLPRSPLHGAQHPLGAWDGRELILFVGGVDPATGKPWPTRLARAAAYNPTTNTWRRIAPMPSPRTGSSAVWDGREVLVVGGSGVVHALAYNASTNRWRQLPHTASRTGAVSVWSGKRLLVWGGRTSNGSGIPTQGAAYDPRTNRWPSLPPAPIRGRNGATGVWTGTELIVWGGGDSYPPFTDGAAFRPAA